MLGLFVGVALTASKLAGPLASVREFTAVREWVRKHTFRFRRDPRDLIERWEIS